MEARKRTGLRAGLGHVEREAALVRQCLSGADSTTLQNILMRIPDKVCAVALSALPEEERTPALARMAPIKAERIREEIRLEARRRTTALVRGRIVRSFLSYFGRAKAAGGPIWIRPKKRS